ncbi:TetR/AcrR family transcriptional regulator [Candidatus Bipolaricaulota bacterium]|nr:TetR/AcrR family transcriptional regulator [Candidatus Bipolaricaulota bacterium]
MGAKEQILAIGHQLLVRDGLRAITTNAVAQRARISKKTLYRYFPSKDELLEEILVSFVEENLSHLDNILKRDEPAIERILASLRYIGEFLPQMQHRVISQVESVAPHLWQIIDDIRVRRLQALKGLMEEAQGDGYLRSDVNPNHWILLLTGTIQSVITPQVLLRTRISLIELLESLQTIYFEGLLTDKGKHYIEETRKRSIVDKETA